MAGPNRDGCGAKEGMALHRVSGPPSAACQAAQAGPVRRERQGEAEDTAWRQPFTEWRPLWRAYVLQRMSDARYARPPVLGEPERPADGKLAPTVPSTMTDY